MKIKVLAGIDLPVDYGSGSMMLARDLYLNDVMELEANFISLYPEFISFNCNNLHLVPLTQQNKINNPEEYFDKLSYYVKGIVSKVMPSIIHCHHLCFPMTSILTRITGVKKIGFCHGTDVIEVKKSKIRLKEVNDNIKNMDALVFPSHGILEDLSHYITLPKSKINIIPWGIPDYFFNFKKKKLPRHNSESFSIIYAGRLDPGKSIETILKALCILPKNILLTIVSRDKLNKTQEDIIYQNDYRITRLDWMEREKLPELLTQHQLLILPSLEIEAFGLIVAEAQALGVPVAVSRISGLIQTIPSSSISMMFEPGNFYELAKIVSSLHASKASWELISSNGITYANTFKMDLFVGKITELTKRILSK